MIEKEYKRILEGNLTAYIESQLKEVTEAIVWCRNTIDLCKSDIKQAEGLIVELEKKQKYYEKVLKSSKE